MTIVVDHDTGRLVWAAVGANMAVLRAFFDQLGAGRATELTHISADAAPWIALVCDEEAPQAARIADPFHIVKWATEELDEVRKGLWRTIRRAEGTTRRSDDGSHISKAGTRAVKHSRWALWENPENLTERQAAKLDWIAKTHPVLHRAWALKEGLRTVFRLGGQAGIEALDRWLKWAARCRIPGFVRLGQRIRAQREPIEASLTTGMSNGLIESTNTKVRVLTRMAYGFKSPEALIALAMLALDGHQPDPPQTHPHMSKKSRKSGGNTGRHQAWPLVCLVTTNQYHLKHTPHSHAPATPVD